MGFAGLSIDQPLLLVYLFVFFRQLRLHQQRGVLETPVAPASAEEHSFVMVTPAPAPAVGLKHSGPTSTASSVRGCVTTSTRTLQRGRKKEQGS
ncbi:unnamed protein product [Brassica oleracea]